MEQFYSALSQILSFAAGEEVVFKSLSQLSAEISALVGQAEWAWIPYFASPINVISLFVHGSIIYALLFILMYLPWRLLRCLFPRSGRKRDV